MLGTLSTHPQYVSHAPHLPPYTYPFQPFHKEHASGMTGICSRNADRDDPADFRS